MTETPKTICGSIGYSDSEADKLVYSSDASEIKGEVECVVWPLNKEQVNKLVIYAKRSKKNIVIRGGGTGLVGGCVPQKSVVMHLARMKKILEVERDYAVVEAGVVLDDLQKKLPESMFFPIIPYSHSACTIGGMIATNASSIMVKKYGRMIDWVEELVVIDGTGKEIRIHKKDVANFVGKEGVTGIIVEAKLRLAKREKTNKTVTLLNFNTIEAMTERLKEVLEEQGVTAIEFLDPHTSNRVGLENKYHLIVEYESAEGEVKDKEEVQTAWEVRKEVYPKLFSQRSYIQLSPQIPLESLDKFLYWLGKNRIPSAGHLSIGVVLVYLKDEKLVDELFKIVNKLGGKVSGEYGVGLRGREYLSKDEIAQIKELKIKYNPQSVLNKGKMVIG